METLHMTVITGGGRGIGRAIALEMARHTEILVVGRTESDLIAVCDQINQDAALHSALYLVGDVSEASTAQAAIDLIHEHGAVVDHLVCNAGIGKGGPMDGFDTETWMQIFGVNVHGAFHFIRACLPDLKADATRRTSVSIIGSTSGLKGHKNDAAYSATKFALVGMGQSLAGEVAKHNCAVSVICPGFVETDMTTRTIAGMIKYRKIDEAEARRRLAQVNLQGRILQPAELAQAVAYTAFSMPISDDANDVVNDLSMANEPRILTVINWLRERASSARRLLVPISGGSDSALVFSLLARVYPDKTVGVFAGDRSKLRCADWFESLGARIEYVDVAKVDVDGDGEGDPGAYAEILRWARFQQMAYQLDAWLVGSRNRTETTLGSYSMASRVATFLPLVKIWKTQVMSMCAAAGVPKAITDSSRRADPDCGRPIEMAEIPLEGIDAFLVGKAVEAGLSVAQIAYLQAVVARNRFNSELPVHGPDLVA